MNSQPGSLQRIALTTAPPERVWGTNRRHSDKTSCLLAHHYIFVSDAAGILTVADDDDDGDDYDGDDNLDDTDLYKLCFKHRDLLF